VVDVGNDGKVADMAQVAHGTSLVRPREIPAEKIVRDSTRWPGGASRPPPKGALVQWVMLWGGVHTGWEESVGPGLSRPAKAGLDRSDRRHAVGRHIAGPHRGCGARARVLVAGKNLWGRAYPGRRRWVGLRRPPTRRRPA